MTANAPRRRKRHLLLYADAELMDPAGCVRDAAPVAAGRAWQFARLRTPIEDGKRA